MLSESLLQKINSKTAKIGIIGLGYVGVPLLVEFAKKGFKVKGFDIDGEKVEMLRQGKSYIKHINLSDLNSHLPNFSATTEFSELSDMDCILICVPTPLNRHREPDMTFIFNTARTISRHLRKGQLIVLESTTYPGTTDEDLRSILEESGLKAGQDFFFAYSPEREDPGNRDYRTDNIPKIVGGYTKDALKLQRPSMTI
ncbi:MAG: NAD(P)-binding domain-containing protein [Candidatus Methanomethyliaceae archaeon]